MSDVFFISDIHIGHKNILKYRPIFSSIEDHDNTIKENILTKVGKKDTLWLLGDCFFDRSGVDFLKDLKVRIGNINWILGNHDTDSASRQGFVREILQAGMINKVGSLIRWKSFWLTHHPIHPAELRGAINIHGHVHNATIKDPNYINVCCENVNYTPVQYSDLVNGTNFVWHGRHSAKNFFFYRKKYKKKS